MGVGQLLLAAFTMTLLASAAAIYAAVCSRQASASSPALKRIRALEATIADLQSSFDELLESHKRLRSKEGMKDLRARRKGAKEPPEDAVQELSPDAIAALTTAERKLYFRRKHFGGMDHRQFALKMQSMDRGADSQG